ncbi:hypothetical protein KAW43_01090 [Candidatus Parcubacteria bacterium]|jgi:hypothetical protein|nr:hypothetical protein [Candidatus Parcubacteria bacterium]
MISIKTLHLINFNKTLAGLLMGFIVVCLSVFYVFQIIQITQESYLVLDYQEDLQELLQANENLEIYFTQNKSLNNVELLAQELNYEKIGKIHYIQITKGVVAAK